MKLTSIIWKNIKLVIRSKTSALVVILGPLLLILLVGAAFNTANIYGIRVGAYSENYSELTNSIINSLVQKQYNVIKTDSKDSCIKGISTSQFHVCVVFPKNLNVESSEQIFFYVDNSRANLVYIIIETVLGQVGAKSEELSLALTTKLISVLSNTQQEASENKAVVSSLGDVVKSSSSQISEIALNLGKVDLTYDEAEFGLSAVYSAISKYEGDNSADLTSVKNTVSRTEGTVKQYIGKIKNAGLERDKAVQGLDKVKSSLLGSNVHISSLTAGLEGISKGIENIEIKEAGKIVSPIKTKIEPLVAAKTHLNYLFPTLIVLVVMFISVLLSSLMVVREKNSAAYFRNFLTPTSDVLFVFANYLSNLIIVLIQMALVFGVSIYFFRELKDSLHYIVLILLIVSTVFILLGMFIGYLFKSEETSILAAIIVGCVLLFFSNTVLPIETLPTVASKIVVYNPFVISESLFNKLILFKLNLMDVSLQIYVLLGIIAGLIILTFVTKKITKQRI